MEGGLRLREKDGYRLLYTGMTLAIVLTGAGHFLGIARPDVRHILAAALSIVLCIGMQMLTVKGRLFGILLTVVFACVIVQTTGVRQWGMFLRSWFLWVTGRSGWDPVWRTGYELLLVAALSVGCYLAQFVLEKFLVVKVLTADILVSLLLFCLLTQWQLSHAGVVFSLCYVIMVYAEWIQREWKKVGSGNRQRSMLWLTPFMALYFFLMLLTPTPEKPYEWEFVRRTCSQIGEVFIGFTQNLFRGGEDDFDMALSGFSEEGNLHDDLEENGREIMTVQGMNSLMTNVYLTGKIYDTFDGKRWLQENHAADSDAFADAMQMQEAARRYEADHVQNYLSTATLRIRYRYFRTSCLFVPLKARRVQAPRGRETYFWDGDNLLFSEKKGFGTAYEVDYYQMNAGTEGFDRFLRAALGQPDNTAEERRERIYEIYGEEVTLSEETRRYLESLTADAGDPLERLRLLEQELSSYTYTKRPEPLPDGIADAGEFLDYFLLESREGYCTHFATAFTLLARALGLPSRYVQGFCVPMKKTETSVYGDMAHAWPEVYLDGAGWIPFEPTPGYAGIRYTPWATEDEEADIAVTYGMSSQNADEGVTAEAVAEKDTAKKEEAPDSDVGRFLTVMGRALLAVCVTGIVALALQRVIRGKRYRRMDAAGKLRMEIAVNLRILKFLGLRRGETETLQEFRERAVRSGMLRVSGEGGERRAEDGCSLRCIEDYEEILYGEKEALPKMVDTAVRERKELMTALREQKRWWYFFFRFRLAAVSFR